MASSGPIGWPSDRVGAGRPNDATEYAVYDDLCHENDPYEEHDFGALEVDGHTIFFKIDLYEEPDVKDSNGEPVVNRVLTIMLADEY